LQQTGAAGTNYFELAAMTKANLRHAPHPGRLTLNILDNGAVASDEQVQREKAIRHGEELWRI
jgi:hypothetical protein